MQRLRVCVGKPDNKKQRSTLEKKDFPQLHLYCTVVQVRERALEGQHHADLPFEQVVELVRPVRSLDELLETLLHDGASIECVPNLVRRLVDNIPAD